MQIALISFCLIAFVMLIMSVGVLMGRKPVQGSCGGLNKIEGMGECELCGGDAAKCEEAVTTSKVATYKDATFKIGA